MQVTGASYIAEFIGAFFFILAIFISGGNAIAVGTALAIVVFLTASISGGHINPAVSLAMRLNGALTNQELVGYALAQLLGGTGAYLAFSKMPRTA